MDIRQLIASRPMTRFQIATVLICQLINILDGFDVVIIAYAAPLIAQDWQLSPASLGVVFSAGLLGMTLGAFLLAPLADHIGRRTTIILGLSIVTIGMLLTYWVTNVPQLIATRLFTGLGIGALFASLTTLVTEYSSEKRRTLAVTVFSLGYPIGATLGGLIARYNIEQVGWQVFFLYGGLITALLIPIALLKLPESLDYLLLKQPKNALKKINVLLKHMGNESLSALPQKSPIMQKQSAALLFSDTYRSETIKLWICFFMALLVSYFLISWTPKILIDSGLPLERSILGGIMLNIGGGAGMLVLGILSSRIELHRLIGGYFVLGAVFMVVFAASTWSLNILLVITMLIGFFAYGSTIGLYALAAQKYPASARSTGVGWAIGVGRIGSIVGPYIGGMMIAWGWERSTYYLILSLPLMVAALSVWLSRSPLNNYR